MTRCPHQQGRSRPCRVSWFCNAQEPGDEAITVDFNTLAELFPLLLLLLGLGFIVAIDPYVLRVHRHTMLVIVGLCLTLVAQNLMENELFVSHTNLALKSALSAYGYPIRPVLLVLFLRIVQPDGSNRISWGLAAANALLYCLSPFTGLCFSIRDGDYAALRGPLWFSCFAVSGILLVELLALSINRYRETRRLEQLIPLAVAAAIGASVVLDFNVGMAEQPISFLTMTIVVGSLFYYIWLHLQFVREHERDLMATQRIQIMMTQIQPHFLFNTLNTIRALYAKDPPLADKTFGFFDVPVDGRPMSFKLAKSKDSRLPRGQAGVRGDACRAFRSRMGGPPLRSESPEVAGRLHPLPARYAARVRCRRDDRAEAWRPARQAGDVHLRRLPSFLR